MECDNLLCNRKSKTAPFWFLLRVCPSVIPVEKLRLFLFTHACPVIGNTDQHFLLCAKVYADGHFCFRRVMRQSINDKVIHRTAEQADIKTDLAFLYIAFKPNPAVCKSRVIYNINDQLF